MSHTVPVRMMTPISEIKIGERDRADLGDLRELAESIRKVGMLHPIVITGDWRLVAGGRRLAAARDVLGWTEVPVTIVDIHTARDVLQAEWDENTCRKPLTPVEAERAQVRRANLLVEDAIRRRNEALSRGRATQAARAAAGSGGAKLADQQPQPQLPEQAPRVPSRSSMETRKIAAAGTGYSATTLAKITSIRTAAEGVIRVGDQRFPAPEPVRAAARRALADVEAGTPVDRAYRQVAQVIDQHIEPDEGQLRARRLKAWRDALGGARMLREFDMRVLPELLSEQDWAAASVLMDQLAEQVDRFRQLRPAVNPT